MIRFCLNKKGVALYIVLTMLLVVVILANVILSLVLSHSRLTHHQVSRIQAYYAAQAGMNYAMEMLRNGAWTADAPLGSIKFACLNGCVDAPASDYTIPADADIPYSVQVDINPQQSGINGTTKLDVKTDYTYSP